MSTTTDTIAIGVRKAEAHKKPRGRLSRLMRDKWTLVGGSLLLLTLAVAMIGPFLAPHGIDEYVGAPFAPPSAAFPLGTDFMGQDVLSRTLAGGWSVVWMSVMAATVGTSIGALLGMIAGYRGGWVDETIMRVSDVWMAFPGIVLTLLVVTMFGRDPWLLVFLIGVAYIPPVARVVRGVTLDVAQREFVESAVALGASPLRVVLTQIMPNITSTLMVEFGLRIVWAVVVLASLSVLGMGIQAPHADWGLMINENRAALTFQPWGVLAPLFLIGFYALALNLIAEGVARTLHVGTDRSER